MPWWEQMLAVVAISAAVAASGGSFGVAIGIGGAAGFAADHANGAATFVDGPKCGWNGYWSHASASSVTTDAAETALTFGPWAFARAASGRGARVLVGDVRAQGPGPWLAGSRAALTRWR